MTDRRQRQRPVPRIAITITGLLALATALYFTAPPTSRPPAPVDHRAGAASTLPPQRAPDVLTGRAVEAPAEARPAETAVPVISVRYLKAGPWAVSRLLPALQALADPSAAAATPDALTLALSWRRCIDVPVSQDDYRQRPRQTRIALDRQLADASPASLWLKPSFDMAARIDWCAGLAGQTPAGQPLAEAYQAELTRAVGEGDEAAQIYAALARLHGLPRGADQAGFDHDQLAQAVEALHQLGFRGVLNAMLVLRIEYYRLDGPLQNTRESLFWWLLAAEIKGDAEERRQARNGLNGLAPLAARELRDRVDKALLAISKRGGAVMLELEE